MKTQKELNAMYAEELKKAWSDEKMVKFCTGKAAYVIEHNGFLYSIEKPRIETRFCFGYGFCGISDQEDEDRADNMAEHARKSTEYFISENMSDINGWIFELREIREQLGYNWAEGSCPAKMIETGAHYCGQTEDCKLEYFCICRPWNGTRGKLCYDVELLDKLIEGYETVKVDFAKRLNTYLKRYGLSKVESWSYLSD